MIAKCPTCGNSFSVWPSRFKHAKTVFCSMRCRVLPPKIKEPLGDRFWKSVDKNGPVPTHCPEIGQCWVWTKSKNRLGYGKSSINGKTIGAHRVSWFLENGKMPELFVCHHCDNPSCVNPSHLFIGSAKDNMLDKTIKGRNNIPLGEKSAVSKLKEPEVIEIRRLHSKGVCQRRIAEKFCVGFKAINKIVLRQRWRHV